MTLLALFFSVECLAARTKKAEKKNKSIERPLVMKEAIIRLRKSSRLKQVNKQYESVGDESWKPFEQWLEQTERCQPVIAKIKKEGMPLRKIAFPAEGSPDFFPVASLQTLFNDFLHQLSGWLESCGYYGAPHIDGYNSGVLPQDAKNDFLDHVTKADPILMPALVHLIHLAFADDSPLDNSGKTFFRFRLEWLDEVIWPLGMEKINWDTEYDELLADYKMLWQSDVAKIPSAKSTVQLRAQTRRLSSHIHTNWENYKYNPALCMLTTWNAVLQLYGARMVLDKVGVRDPFQRQHIKFVLAASLLGTYLVDEDRTLAAYWLRSSEIDSHMISAGKNDWLENVVNYYPPGAEKRDDFNLRSQEDKHGDEYASASHKKKTTVSKTRPTRSARSTLPVKTAGRPQQNKKGKGKGKGKRQRKRKRKAPALMQGIKMFADESGASKGEVCEGIESGKASKSVTGSMQTRSHSSPPVRGRRVDLLTRRAEGSMANGHFDLSSVLGSGKETTEKSVSVLPMKTPKVQVVTLRSGDPISAKPAVNIQPQTSKGRQYLPPSITRVFFSPEFFSNQKPTTAIANTTHSSLTQPLGMVPSRMSVGLQYPHEAVVAPITRPTSQVIGQQPYTYGTGSYPSLPIGDVGSVARPMMDQPGPVPVSSSVLPGLPGWQGFYGSNSFDDK